MNRVFLDSAYAISLSIETDSIHAQARKLALRLELEKLQMVTTRAVMLEIGNALSRVGLRSAAVQLLDALEVDPFIECVPLSDDLYSQGLKLFRNRPDKSWGLIDCVSFVVIEERGITEALTMDAHFEQAGFRALLKNP